MIDRTDLDGFNSRLNEKSAARSIARELQPCFVRDSPTLVPRKNFPIERFPEAAA